MRYCEMQYLVLVSGRFDSRMTRSIVSARYVLLRGSTSARLIFALCRPYPGLTRHKGRTFRTSWWQLLCPMNIATRTLIPEENKFYYTTFVPYKGKRTRKICQRITLYNPGLTGFLLMEEKAKTKCGRIIKLLFGVWSIIRADTLLIALIRCMQL